MVINPQFVNSRDFFEGLASFLVIDKDNEEKIGFIDKSGNIVISPQFSPRYSHDYLIMSRFKEGLALVRVGGKDSGKYGYISR